MTHSQLAALAGDQLKYFDYSLHWPDLLNQQIPFGFPLFLRLVGWIDKSYRILPYLTLTMWGVGLAILFWCLRRAAFRPSIILGIMAPLSINIAMRPWAWHGNPIFYANTERLTAILSVVLFGLVVLAIKEERFYWPLGVLVFIMCLVRPAMLFVPGVVLLMVPRRKIYWPLSFIFLMFIALRWDVSGDLSFASEGAIQATRIYAPLVQPDDVEKVPANYRGLLRDILAVPKGPTDTILDRASDRDLYTKWMTGDRYQGAVNKYIQQFPNASTANENVRMAWSWVSSLHEHERILLYARALRVALGKFPDPVMIVSLGVVLWGVVVKRMRICELDIKPVVLVVKWTGLWMGLSIAMLLCVQYPDDRYMQISWFWVPSCLGSCIALIW